MYRAICPVCKNVFETKATELQIFCNQKCYHQYRKGKPLYKKGVIKKCENCGKDFYVIQSRKDEARFCSYKCLGETNFLIKKMTHIKGKCPQCGNQFEYDRFGKGAERKYCSDSCRRKNSYWSGKKTLVCIKCGKEFTINKGQQYKRKYCSKECRDQDQRDNFGKITQRNGVKRYFKRRNLIHNCDECGYDEHPEILGIHHKDNNGKNHSFDNLIILCPNCHAIKHGKHLIHWGGH